MIVANPAEFPATQEEFVACMVFRAVSARFPWAGRPRYPRGMLGPSMVFRAVSARFTWAGRQR
jgi:hypothetical protein